MLGGAFDPPHLTHVNIAARAIEQLQLDRLHVVPTGQPPHRSGAVASGDHRMAMLGLAFAALPKAVLDRRELDSPEPGYTLHTLRSLCQEFPTAALFLVIGQDQWRHFERWHLPNEIKAIATICVAERVVNTWTDGGKEVRIGSTAEKVAPSADFGSPLWLGHSATDFSATAVRQALAEGHAPTLQTMLNPQVLRYIATHRLYGYSAPDTNPSLLA
jgi:nicotinate-nucleotide adenylyltransferase